jgi:hypothetical protein
LLRLVLVLVDDVVGVPCLADIWPEILEELDLGLELCPHGLVGRNLSKA